MMGRGMELGRLFVFVVFGEFDFMVGFLVLNWCEECCRVFGVG